MLRGVGDNIEVWVAEDIQFPAGDCRNGARTEITDAQVDYFIAQFDNNIYPTESDVFTVPPDRATATQQLHSRRTLDFSGAGEKIVTLVDNVGDENFYRHEQRAQPDLRRRVLLPRRSTRSPTATS